MHFHAKLRCDEPTGKYDRFSHPMTMKHILLCCACLLFALPGDVKAGWLFQSKAEALEGYRRNSNPIALVTLHKVRRKEAKQ